MNAQTDNLNFLANYLFAKLSKNTLLVKNWYRYDSLEEPASNFMYKMNTSYSDSIDKKVKIIQFTAKYSNSLEKIIYFEMDSPVGRLLNKQIENKTYQILDQYLIEKLLLLNHLGDKLSNESQPSSSINIVKI